MSLERLNALEAAMWRHLRRWRHHDDIPYNSVRVSLQSWYAARYKAIYNLWVDEINATDSIIEKQWYHDHAIFRDHHDILNEKRIYGG